MTEQSAIDQMLSRLLSARLGFEFVHWPFEAHRLLEAMAVEDGTDVMTVLSRIRLGYTPERMTRLVDAATISHTMLFRHPEQFEYLAEVAAPRLLERNPGGLKVWSAGCATGEEPYSIAWLLSERGIRVEVHATDVSAAAIEQARLGRYTKVQDTRLEAELEGGCWTVPEGIRSCVHFREGSLVDPDFIADVGPFDLIFCRNVLIYFQPDAAADLLGVLSTRLRTGGSLVVSPVEALLPLPSDLCPEGAVGWLKRQEVSHQVDDVAERGWSLRPERDRGAPSIIPPPPLASAAQSLSSGQLDEAEGTLRESLGRDPNSAISWFLLGEVLTQRGESAQARAAYARVESCDSVGYGKIDLDTVRNAASRRANMGGRG